MTTLMLVESPDGRQMCVPFVINALKMENVKRGYRKTGWRVVAVYRRRAPEPVTYDSEGVED